MYVSQTCTFVSMNTHKSNKKLFIRVNLASHSCKGNSATSVKLLLPYVYVYYLLTCWIWNSTPMRYRVSKSSGNRDGAALFSGDFSLESAEGDRFRFLSSHVRDGDKADAAVSLLSTSPPWAISDSSRPEALDLRVLIAFKNEAGSHSLAPHSGGIHCWMGLLPDKPKLFAKFMDQMNEMKMEF